jgi:KUP system potassium uptake protein
MSAENTARPLKVAGQAALTIGALGVVFGDIGTSPLYTLNETLGYLPPMVRAEGILGSLSLMFWALSFAVCFKYIGFITRADNAGEGGIFALLALGHRDTALPSRKVGVFTLLILFGAALLYGDGVITPAISVLGAMEGLITLHAGFEPFVPTLAAVILAVLFMIQNRGTHAIGRAFGPVMVVWFIVIAVFGLWHLVQTPDALRALNPWRGVRLLLEHPAHATAILGSVTLAITGTEALYADMGHFGRRAITRAWYGAAFPGLVLSYFGQGAYALGHPDERLNPFFAQAPDGPLRWLLIALSTAAAIIASQALISGTYSLTRQAIQLGYFPRLQVRHTNPHQVGQIYLPLVNATLAVLSIGVVFAFGSVARLTTAYGIAVTGTMVITTLAFYRVARVRWQWSRAKALPLCIVFLVFDGAFFISNLHKFPDGGWLPFLMGAVLLAVMHTWKTGRSEVHQRVYRNSVTDPELIRIARSSHLTRVEGGAVFMMGSPRGAPAALLHHVKSNRSLQKTVVLLSLVTDEIPSVAESDRMEIVELGEGLWRVIGHYGYMESPDATALLLAARDRGIPINPAAATFYFNRELIMSGGDSVLWGWQRTLYGFLSRNARPAKDYFNIPPSQIIEIGLPVQL